MHKNNGSGHICRFRENGVVHFRPVCTHSVTAVHVPVEIDEAAAGHFRNNIVAAGFVIIVLAAAGEAEKIAFYSGSLIDSGICEIEVVEIALYAFVDFFIFVAGGMDTDSMTRFGNPLKPVVAGFRTVGNYKERGLYIV